MTSGNPRGAIIYAGGMEEKTISRHFSPDEKGTLLEYVLDSVWTVADELNIVFRHEPDLSVIEAISSFGARVTNVPSGMHPISGILSAFKSSKSDYCILATEGVPLLKPNIVLALFDAAHGFDLSVPRWENGRIEPLLAVYNGRTLLRLASSITMDPKIDLDSTMSYLANQLFDVKYLSVEGELEQLDPELDSFLKVEDEESLASARLKASIRGSKQKKSD